MALTIRKYGVPPFEIEKILVGKLRRPWVGMENGNKQKRTNHPIRINRMKTKETGNIIKNREESWNRKGSEEKCPITGKKWEVASKHVEQKGHLRNLWKR